MIDIKFRYVFKHTKDGDIITKVFSLEKIEKYPLKNYQSIENYLAEDGYLCIDKLQYTGLKDKNFVEIYEGDIIKYHQAEYNENTELYEDRMTVCEWYDDQYAAIVRTDEVTLITPNSLLRTKVIEVIGNIYENQELLKDNI